METLIRWEWIIMFGIALGLGARELLSHRAWRRARERRLTEGRGEP